MVTKRDLNITIFGIGAMGSLFGSYLSPYANVTLFGNWPAQIEALRDEGLTIIRPDGRHSHHKMQVTNNLIEAPPADVVLILVKSHQTARAARQAAQILRPDGLALTLQNGLGNLDQLAEAVGRDRATLGVTSQGATTLAPGRLYHAGAGPTYLALAPGLEARLEGIADLFNVSGLETTLVEDAAALMWGKLAINAAINPLTALLEVPNGDLVENESLRQLMADAACEVAQVAAAQGIDLPYTDAARQAAQVSQATASNRSSMLQDVSRAAPTEIDAISGAVVRLGRYLGIPTPVNELLLRLMKDKEAGRLAVNSDKLKGLNAQFSGAI